MGDDNSWYWTEMCANVWASVVGFAAGILFLIVGILALVPASPFSHRERTLGIALVVLGATGVASYAGTIVGCVSGLGIGFCLDKTCFACQDPPELMVFDSKVTVSRHRFDGAPLECSGARIPWPVPGDGDFKQVSVRMQLEISE
ncbi:hypothetical protein R1sor_023198 [Riccia sorocarpa]|uniref:Transmembrane protein n=1 Tax=Riccia sorocarpa TaxID=122646 RepID=A0ABD3GQ07_9MARC